MQPQDDESAYDWIRRGRNPLVDSRDAGWAGNFVSHLMPPVFEAYAKVFHRIEACYENIDKPLRGLIPAFLTSDVLECLEVTSRTRIDSFAPMP